MRVTVVGLGEAGALYARGLRDAGYEVLGFDPFTSIDEPGIAQHADLATALEGTELVLTLVGARAAEAVTADVLEHLAAGTMLADLNTGSPALKRALGARAAAAGVRFVDVAVLAPVPRAGARTPLMASGADAAAFAQALAATGAAIESIGGEPGDAAARKLIRSVFMKGMAATMLEAVGAAGAAGCEPWLREQIGAELAGDPQALVDRLLDGSRQHAARRVHEVEDAAAYLATIDQPSWTMQAARSWLSSLEHAETH